MAQQERIHVNMDFAANTSQAKAQVQELNNMLNKMAYGTDINVKDDKIKAASEAAKQLSVHLKNAYNTNTGKLDLSLFNKSLNQSNQNLSTLARNLTQGGKDGRDTFMQLSRAVAEADQPTLTLNSHVEKLGQTLKNTIRWQISTAMISAVTNSVSQAITYAEKLNTSLNNIRIVTGKDADEMRTFAEEANKAARALSTTTTKYTDASLIYYQQGLSDKEVKERTDTTVKMANVTRDSVKDVSNYMTAIWNNFSKPGDNLELYSDKITALGAATASSSAEIAAGLEKFASISQTIGLSYDYATTALATVVAQTRQSEDVVGNAFKTIFQRMEGLKLNGVDEEDGTTLNKYSEALLSVGVNIKDANGQLKDMDVILDELGTKWKGLDRETQIALAQTVGGARQYNNLVALMDNWDTFQKNLQITLSASGSLQDQADIYADSWEAARKRVQASTEAIYSDLINDKAIIKATDFVANLIDGVDNFIDHMGGLKAVLTGIGTIGMSILSKNITPMSEKIIYDLKLASGLAQKEYTQRHNENVDLINKELNDNSGKYTEAQKRDLVNTKELSMLKSQLAEKVSTLSETERIQAEQRIEEFKQESKQLVELAQKYDDLIKKQEESNGERDKASDNLNKRVKEATSSAFKNRDNEQQRLQREMQQASSRVNFVNNLDNIRHDETLFNNDGTVNQQKDTFLQRSYGVTADELQRVLRLSDEALNNYVNDANNAFRRAQGKLDIFNQNRDTKLENKVSAALGGIVQGETTKLFKTNGLLGALDMGLTGSSDYNSKIKIINDNMEKLRANLPGLNNDFNKFTDSIRSASTEAEREDAWNKLSEKLQSFKITAGSTEEQLEQLERIIKVMNPSFNGFSNSLKTAIKTLQTAEKNSKEYEQALKQIKKEYAEMGKNFDDNVQTIDFSHKITGLEAVTSAAAGLGSVVMAFNQLKSAFTTLADPDTTGWEKFSALTMGISFAIPSLLSGLKSLNVLQEYSTVVLTKQNAQEALNAMFKNNVLKRGQAENALKSISVILNKDYNSTLDKQSKKELILAAARKGVISSEQAESLLKRLNIKLAEGENLEKTKLITLLKLEAKERLAALAPLAPYLVAIGALVALVALTVKEYKAQAEANKSATEQLADQKKITSELNTELSNTKQRVDDLKSSWESLTSAKETLENLVSGTVEWKEQLLTINSQVMALIEKYPELSKYMSVDSNGMFSVDSEGYNEVLDQQLNAMAAQTTLVVQSKQKEFVLEQQKTNESIAKEAYDQMQKNYKDNFKSYAKGEIAGNKPTSFLNDEYNKVSTTVTSGSGNTSWTDVSLDAQQALANLAKEFEDGEKPLTDFNDLIDEYKVIYKNDADALEEFRIAVLNSKEALDAQRGALNKEALAATNQNNELYNNFENKDALLNFLSNSKEYDERPGYTGAIGRDQIEEYLSTRYGQNWQDTYVLRDSNRLVNIETGDKIAAQDIIAQTRDYLNNQAKNIITETDIEKATDAINDISKILDTLNITDEEVRNQIITDTAKQGIDPDGDYTIDASSTDFNSINQAIARAIQNGDDKLKEALRESYEKKVEAIAQTNAEFLDGLEQTEAENLNEELQEAGLSIEDFEAYKEVIAETNEEIRDNADAVEDMAKANIKNGNAMSKLNKIVEDNKDALESADHSSLTYIHAIGELQKTLTEYLGVALKQEEVQELWDNGVIQDAIAGDEAALERLQNAAADDIIAHFDIDSTTFYEQLQSLEDETAWFQEHSDIDVNAKAHVNGAIESLNELLAAGQITAEQAQKYLNSIGYEANIESVEGPPIPTTIRIPPIKVMGVTVTDGGEITVETIPRVPKITPVGDKRSNGKTTNYVGHKAAPVPTSTIKPTSGGSSGGGKEKKVEEYDKTELKKYTSIDQVLGDIEHKLNLVSKAKDAAFGNARIKQIDKELKLLKQEDKALDVKKKLNEQYLKDVTNKLVKNYGGKKDSNGLIINYAEMFAKEQKAYNDAVTKFNKSAQTERDERDLEAAKERWENFQKYYDEYGSEIEVKYQLDEEDLNNQLEQVAKKLEKIEYTVEVKLELNENYRGYLEYLQNLNSRKKFGQAEEAANITKWTTTYTRDYDTNKAGINDLFKNHGLENGMADYLAMTEEQRDEWVKSQKFTEQEAKDYVEYLQGMMDATTATIEQGDRLNELYHESLSEYTENADKQIDRMSTIIDQSNTYLNILGLMNKKIGQADGLTKKLRESQMATTKASVEASQAMVEGLDKAIKTTTNRLNTATNEETKRFYQDELNALLDEKEKYQEQILDGWQQQIEIAQAIFEDSVKEALENVYKSISKYADFDDLQAAYDRAKKIRDEYVDDFNKTMSLNKLARSTRALMDDTKNVKNKKILRDYQEEITRAQAEGNKMSEYDINYLTKKLELKRAEIALEESQNNANQVTLTQDDNGNWSYVYTANQDDRDKAIQDYEDRMADLYNMSKDYADTIQENLLRLISDREKALQDAADKYGTDSAEYRKAVEEISAFYDWNIMFLQGELEKVFANNTELYNNDLHNYQLMTGSNISQNMAFQTNFQETVLGSVVGFTNQTLPQWVTAVQDSWDEADKAMMAAVNNFNEQLYGDGTPTDPADDSLAGRAKATVEQMAKEAETNSQIALDAVKDMVGKSGKNGSGMLGALYDIQEGIVTWAKTYNNKISGENGMIATTDAFAKAIYGNGSSGKNGGLLGKIKAFGDFISSDGVNELGDYKKALNAAKTEATKLKEAINKIPANKKITITTEYKTVGDPSNGNNNSSGSDDAKTQLTKILQAYIGVTADGVWGEQSSSRAMKQPYYADNRQDLYEYYLAHLDTSKSVDAGKYNIATNLRKQFSSFASGGYTGEWDSSGKLAVLHQKEIVLNKDDTKNFLAGIEILRDITKTLDLQALTRTKVFNAITIPTVNETPQTIEQKVEITASFPNAVDHSEIEEAFDNLLGKATQFAERNKK